MHSGRAAGHGTEMYHGFFIWGISGGLCDRPPGPLRMYHHKFQKNGTIGEKGVEEKYGDAVGENKSRMVERRDEL